MPKGISISVASDTRAFQRGVQTGMVEPLEDVTEVLKDVERAGDDAGSQLESTMRDAQSDTRKAEDAMGELERKIRDARSSTRDFGDSGRRAGRDFDDGIDRAKQGLDDFKDEAGSTAREAAASFDGSAQSVGDAFQEVAANAFGGFGIVGAGAGIAAAAGIGLATAAFEELDAANQASQERIDEWASKYIEAGGRILDAQTYISAANEILTDGERYREAARNAELWGVSIETAVAAMTGQHDALAQAQANVTRAAEEEAAALEGVPYDDVGTNMAAMNSQAAEAQRALNGITGEMDQGSERASIMSGYLAELARTTEGATREVDEFGDSVTTLPDGTVVYIDAETGQATTNVDAIERRIYGIPDGDSTIRVRVDDSAIDRYFRRQLDRTATIRVNTIARPGLPVMW